MQVSDLLKQPFDEEQYLQLLAPVKDKMPEVTLRLGDWLRACPENTVHIVMNSAH